MRTRLLGGLTALALPLVACGLSMKVPGVDLQTGETQPPQDAAAADAGDSGEAGAGLPCEVASLLEEHCTSCHSRLHPGVPMALVTYDDLVAPATTDPAKKVYELALARMRDGARPMPASGLLGADTIAVFATWASAGAEATTCGRADTAVPPRADAGLPECVLNSDCPGTLVCRSGACDVECITDKDCTVTWSCVETRCHPPTPPDAPVDASAE